jgi:DNA-binding transcriptional ArsR family regulator
MRNVDVDEGGNGGCGSGGSGGGGNRYDDFEITDPKAMRALAHPVRLAILERLQVRGAATASQLAPHVGATASVTSWHLRHLAGFGLVRDAQEVGPDRRERRWEAVSRGFRIAVEGAGAETDWSAVRVLSAQLFERAAELPRRWAAEAEPRLEPEWRGLAGVSSTGLVVSRDELAEIEEAIEAVLAPYVIRDRVQPQPGRRGVRIVRYVLPEVVGVEGSGEGGQGGEAS